MTRRLAVWGLAGALSAGVVIVVIAAVLISATTVTRVRESQVTNTGTLNNTDRTLEILLDCTDPTGDCYKRGQASQASAIEDISRISVYAAACADKPREQTAEQIQECILDLVDDEPKR